MESSPKILGLNKGEKKTFSTLSHPQRYSWSITLSSGAKGIEFI